MPDNLSQNAFDEIAHQFAVDIRQGRSPQIKSYAEQHPELASKILQLFPVLEIMERNGLPVDDISESSLSQAQAKYTDALKIKQLGDYRILREIGRGGMGIVFEAQQESLGRRVALKLLPDSAQFDSRRQQRFQAEARASAMLHHTNIVPVFGVGEHNGTSYFVMQYIEGKPLNDLLNEISKIRSNNSRGEENRTTPIAAAEAPTLAEQFTSIELKQSVEDSDRSLPADDTFNLPIPSSISNDQAYWKNLAKLGMQIASALQHAHSKKILHRDIKPSNLLVDQEGVAWITDFGLAKYFESPDLTKTGEVIGTLRYMSPEQMNGVADERSDIFGLGLTLYEMATLRPAYNATERSKLVQQVIAASPKPLRSINRNIPKDLETIVQKCIASDTKSRYQRASQIADDLQRFIDGHPVHARRINPLERVAKWCRRRPAISALLAALIISLLAGITGIAWQWQKTTDALSLANTNLTQAEKQKEIAQTHFRQARESVNHFFVKISNTKLLREQRLLGLRKELLSEALSYHQDFVKTYQDNDELKLELAKSLFTIASIESEYERGPAQLEKLEKPRQIFADIHAANPDSETAIIGLAKCYSAEASIMAGFDIEASLEKSTQTIALLENFLIRINSSIPCMEELANSYQRVGLICERIGKANREFKKARNNYENALLLREKIQQHLASSSAPSAAVELKNEVQIAMLHRDLGITYRMAGKTEQAIEHYDEAVDILSVILESDPPPLEATAAMASVANTIGFFYGTQDEHRNMDKSLEFFELSKEQYQVLVNENPFIISYQSGLARAALNVGAVHQHNQDFELALMQRELAETTRRKLFEANSSAPQLRSEWASSLNAVGSTLRDMGRIEEALEKHSQAHNQHCEVVKTDPNQTQPRLKLINGLTQTTKAHVAAGDFQKALDTLLTIEEFTLKNQTEPIFQMAVDLMILACEIDKATAEGSDIEEANSLQREIVAACKSAFQEAAKRGCDVHDWVGDDVDFEDFKDEQACIKITKWIEDNFGPH